MIKTYEGLRCIRQILQLIINRCDLYTNQWWNEVSQLARAKVIYGQSKPPKGAKALLTNNQLKWIFFKLPANSILIETISYKVSSTSINSSHPAQN